MKLVIATEVTNAGKPRHLNPEIRKQEWEEYRKNIKRHRDVAYTLIGYLVETPVADPELLFVDDIYRAIISQQTLLPNVFTVAVQGQDLPLIDFLLLNHSNDPSNIAYGLARSKRMEMLHQELDKSLSLADELSRYGREGTWGSEDISWFYNIRELLSRGGLAANFAYGSGFGGRIPASINVLGKYISSHELMPIVSYGLGASDLEELPRRASEEYIDLGQADREDRDVFEIPPLPDFSKFGEDDPRVQLALRVREASARHRQGSISSRYNPTIYNNLGVTPMVRFAIRGLAETGSDEVFRFLEADFALQLGDPAFTQNIGLLRKLNVDFTTEALKGAAAYDNAEIVMGLIQRGASRTLALFVAAENMSVNTFNWLFTPDDVPALANNLSSRGWTEYDVMLLRNFGLTDEQIDAMRVRAYVKSADFPPPPPRSGI